MPPEPLPWDRFKERRYDRPPPDAVGSSPRWRDQPPHHGFRGRLPGNGRPGPWRYHSAESGRGFAPSRGSDKFVGDDGFRPSGYRMDGRYNRFNRNNNKGPFGDRDIRGHNWENGMSPNSSGRPYFGSDQRSVDDRGSFGPKDLKNHGWESGRLQTGGDPRAYDEKGSFGRRDLRGKSWENGMYPENSGRPHTGIDQNSVDDKAPLEKKDLKRRSPDSSVLPNSTDRFHVLNEERSLDEKGSSGFKDLRGKSCENCALPNLSGSLHTEGDKSLLEDKDIKEHTVENGVVQNRSEPSDRAHIGCDQSPVDDLLIFTSPTQSELARKHDEHSKDQFDKSSGANDVAPVLKSDKENSLVSIDWKPLKWSRSGSLSSRGSGFSHSNCAKSPDSGEPKTEMPPHHATPLRSPSGEATPGATVSAVSSDEAGSRKKPRLGWGEGLAKFEKKKVEGPDDDSATKPGVVVCAGGEPSPVPNLADKSPRVAGFLDCVSPATHYSAGCSSSPDVEDKACVKSANLDYDTSCSSGSPIIPLQVHKEKSQEKEFCLENVELISLANLSSSLTEMLEDPTTVESNFVKSTAMNKLLVWRGEALKALEATESEIDSLENGLKKLISESVSSCPRQAKPCEDVPSTMSQPAQLQAISSGGVEMTDRVSGEDNGLVRNEDLDNLTSEFVEPLNEVRVAVSSHLVENKSCDNMDVDVIENLEKDGNIEGLSVSEGNGYSIAAFSREREAAVCDQILASNNDTAIKAFEVFGKLLPSNQSSTTISSITSWKDNPRLIEKFVFKKRSRKFEEKVNVLKYKALQHLWKEDLQLMSLKKNHPKSQKRLELSSRGPYSGSKKHRSLRSRSSTAAGNLSLVPTSGAINFTSKLLSDSQLKPYRNFLKMPALIMDKKERITSRFISNNGLVEDPCAVEKERVMVNPWMKEEKEIFMDKFSTFGKDFNKISSFLDHKTTADCVEFYYKNHKSDWFVKLKKQPDLAKQGKSYSFNNYLVGSGNRWSRETNAASLDVLGEASAIAASADKAMKTRQEASCSKAPKFDGPVKRSSDLDVSINERETEAADVLAGICGSFSSEAMGSCITSSIDRGDGYKELINQRVDSDDESCSDDSRGEMESNDWTDEEKSLFIQAVTAFGNDFAMISRRVGTKSREQCKVFFSKARKCFGLDRVPSGPCGEGKDDNNSGGSDVEGTCVVEADSVVSSEKSSSKGDRDVVLSDADMNDLRKDHDESKKMMVDDVIEERNLEVDLEGDAKMENGGDIDSIIVNPKNTFMQPDMKEGKCMGEAVSLVGLVPADVKNDHSVPGSGAEDPGQDSGYPRAGEQEMVSKNNSNDREDENNLNDNHESTGNCIRDLNCVQDLHESGDNASNVAAMPSAAQVDSGANIKQELKIPLDLNPSLESLDISLGEDSCPVNGTSMSAGGIPSSTRDDFERIPSNLYKKSTSTDTCTQHQSGPPSVLVGYPLQVAVKTEMNGDHSQDGYFLRCNGSDSHEQKKSHLRHHSWSSSSDTEKPRSGDVKLFGQILKPHPKESSIKSTSENSNQKLIGTNTVELESVVGKFDRNNYLGLDKVSTRSFGFWDGNRVLTGFPSLPDSAILLAKYPAAFGNFSSTSNNIEQQQQQQQQVFQSVVKCNSNNDHNNLNGMSVFPSREMTSGSGVVDYQLYRNQQDLISEMQRRSNGMGAFSGLQSPIGVIGTNVGISDPVAAIKMHYAKVEQYGGGGGGSTPNGNAADLGR